MSESALHQLLVQLLIENVKRIVPQELWGFICADINQYNLPSQMVEGYRPDVFYQYKNTMIIGEAKTSNDVERRHSREQYKAYVRKCSLFQGKAHLLIAVPWTEYATACNIVHRVKNQYPGDYTYKVIEGFETFYETNPS